MVDRMRSKRYLLLSSLVRPHCFGPERVPGVRAMIFVRQLSIFVVLVPCCALVASAQSDPVDNPQRPAVQPAQATCIEARPEDDSFPLCLPPSSVEEDTCPPANAILAKISLQLPNGTALRVALDQRTRVDHPGEIVHGRVVEAVYAFDQPVIPDDSIVSGRIIGISPVSGVKRTLAYANGNFSPFHKYEVSFETLTLPDGKQLPDACTASSSTCFRNLLTGGSIWNRARAVWRSSTRLSILARPRSPAKN